MVSILTSEKKKSRRNAENWLHLAQKVYHYRRDLLKEKELQELVGACQQVREALKKPEDPSRVRLATERLEDCVRRFGGTHYRRSGWAENVEVILVAAILAIGIRTFFVQPFKIPTNSMWPTYHGMTYEVFAPHEEEPGGAAAAFRKVAFGASRRSVESPVSGELFIPIYVHNGQPTTDVPYRGVPSRRFLVFPGQAREYNLYVGETPVPIEVPLDFGIEPVLQEAFFPEASGFGQAIVARMGSGNVRIVGGNTALIPTGRHVEAGETLFSFDILTGDQLFVDRMSYHFIRPRIGDGFVFRTEGIAKITDDKYYIKRLVGTPGDTLEIDAPVLLRNGEPIGNRPVFEQIQNKEGVYTGYVNRGHLSAGETVTIPENAYFALGDNSPNSSDSREWGFVPEDQLVGRSLFIYYPFTKRWGPAR